MCYTTIRKKKNKGEKTMNKTERINELKRNIFLLSMKDRWTSADFEQDHKWNNELRELTKEG